MYLPYIRGKQFELIGVRDIAGTILSTNRNKVSPIIEPVKNSSTLTKTLRELIYNDVNFTIIINPRVGSFREPDKIFDVIKESVGSSRNYQIGIIFDSLTFHDKAIEKLQEYIDYVPALSIIHNTVFDNVIDIMKRYGTFFSVKYNIINISNTTKRYHRNFNNFSLVELDDYFQSKTRNSDYLCVEESIFSEEHLFYEEEGFVGFADYLSIGEEYSESGFLPYAVAIHLSYNELETNRIKVRHFVSDSNDDTSDVGGKFAEALEKLIIWCDNTGYDSAAIPFYREFHRTGHFPGLGTLKKLSLINHIDLVLKLI